MATQEGFKLLLLSTRCRFSGRRGVFRGRRQFLTGHTYDVGVMVIFLFEMVFMDTALTIVTGACAERWKFITFSIVFGAHGRVHLSNLRQLGMGRWLALAAGSEPRYG